MTKLNAAMTSNAATLWPGQVVRHNGQEFVVRAVQTSYRKGTVTIYAEDGRRFVVGSRSTVEVVQ